LEEEEELNKELRASNSELRKKLAHLSSLLNDSEATNSKLTELTEVLKEEIRKEQRNEERQKHLEQTEYIKNVFFKVSVEVISAHRVSQFCPQASTRNGTVAAKTLGFCHPSF
jgi:hypothetical protein